ncbi:MAG: TrbC/VirB2 family protein [Neisseriaceae bacterium]|nr:TrbC/VirB2 family protein [Neisseriaceae bacterium]
MKLLKKIDKKEVKEWILAFFLCMPFAAVYAAGSQGTPSWATETVGLLDKLITGLKWVGGAIATIVLLWSGAQIMWGGKQLQDMKYWIIGAIIFAASGHIVAVFFPDYQQP